MMNRMKKALMRVLSVAIVSVPIGATEAPAPADPTQLQASRRTTLVLWGTSTSAEGTPG